MQQYFEGGVIAGLTFFLLNRLFAFLGSGQTGDRERDKGQTDLFKMVLEKFSTSIDKLADRLERLATSNEETNRITGTRLTSVEGEIKKLEIAVANLAELLQIFLTNFMPKPPTQ